MFPIERACFKCCTRRHIFATRADTGIDLEANDEVSAAVVSCGENNVGGEVVQFTVREEIDTSVHCPDVTGYAVRDSATLKGSLALLTSAMVAQDGARVVDGVPHN